MAEDPEACDISLGKAGDSVDAASPQSGPPRGRIRLSLLHTVRECLTTSKVIYAGVLVLLLLVYETVREFLASSGKGAADSAGSLNISLDDLNEPGAGGGGGGGGGGGDGGNATDVGERRRKMFELLADVLKKAVNPFP